MILETAAALFRDKGFQATSMKDIAVGVGVEAASLYNHIKSKQELLEQLLLVIADRFTAGMTDVTASSLSPKEKFEQLLRLHIRMTMEHPDSVALINSEWVHLAEPARSRYKSLESAYERDFLTILKACIEAGDFQQVDPRIALFSTLSTLRLLPIWYRKNKDISPIDLEKHIMQCLVDGLR